MSDTHLPRHKRLPAPLWQAVDAADVVVHAGDWCDSDTLDAVGDRARRLIGVQGNNDDDEVCARLPEVAYETVGGVRLAVVHETGGKQGRERRAAAAYPDVDVLVFGHSHIPWDTTADTGLRLLNPGSPTERRAQPHCTYLTATASGGSLHGVTLHRLPRRR
jgi:hypothetical protein